MTALSKKPARQLGVADLEVPVVSLEDLGLFGSEETHAKAYAPLPESDPVLRDTLAALEMGFAGVILSGPPGTGKSVYAKRIAEQICGEQGMAVAVQFHNSYQYEDFMEGFVPTASGGFQREWKVFGQLCLDAAKKPEAKFVLLIDEISRCDVARVFGEALTYIESDKRGAKFLTASGRELSVPPNIVILATMNPWDRGVDDLDAALERRFAQIDVPSNPSELRRLLLERKTKPEFADKVATFLTKVLSMQDDTLHLGHAFFLGCVDEDAARRTWAFRVHPFFKKATRLDPAALKAVEALWKDVVPAPTVAQQPPASGVA